jgi:hypothetical protein
LLCGILAIAASRGEERQRVGWPIASFGFLYAVSIAGFVGAVPQTIFDALVRAAVFIVPLGITYSALSRRLYDIGFIVNRAVVFSTVSGILIGSFVLLEWALGKWFDQSNAGIAANSALALAFGLSLRFVHQRVDLFVDNVFFKRRHDDVAALKRFAHEAALITEHDALLDATSKQVLKHSEASSAKILTLGVIDQNDPAIVAMRTWHDAVDLHRYDTAIVGEYAFPMLARGTLLGVLVCGPKKSGEAFAPDELDALNSLAHGVGLALEGLARHRGHDIGSLHEAITSLRADMIARLDALSGESDAQSA